MSLRRESRDLWGDGFASDSILSLAGASSWECCSPDEYILLFPRLVPGDGHVPNPIRAHLKACVAARAWRLERRSAVMVSHLLGSTTAKFLAAHGARHHAGWFADDPGSKLARLFPQGTRAPDWGDDLGGLLFLDRIATGLDEARRPELGPHERIAFAYLSGIHPVYLWPGASLSHEVETVAGWLGFVGRGRPALMTAGIADTIVDLIRPRGEDGVAVCDAFLAGIMNHVVEPKALRDLAMSKQAGHDPRVRPTRFRVTAPSRAAWPRMTLASGVKS